MFYLNPIQFVYLSIQAIIRILFLTVFGIPIVFFSFFKSVYNFGPAHTEKKALLGDILHTPIPQHLEMREFNTQICVVITKLKVHRQGFHIGTGKKNSVPLHKRGCIYNSFYSSHTELIDVSFINARTEI